MTRRISFLIVLLSFIFFSQAGIAMAGSTVIEVRTEGSGDIINELPGGATNSNGAMVWNGTEWVVNNTWAHKFFVDVRTGERLKSYNSVSYQGTSPLIDSFGNYSVTRSVYSYEKPGISGGGIYRETGAFYTITDTITGSHVLLLSRGLGLGAARSYFDVYIEMQTSSLLTPITTTALLGDPVWYQIPGLAADALAMTDISPYRVGSLPGAITRQGTFAGDYYLDIGGGSDLGPAGVGLSYEFHTDGMNPADAMTQSLLSAFISDFNLKYMDASGNLQMLSFAPGLVSEEYIPNSSVPEPMSLVLLGLALPAVIAYRKRCC